MGHNPSQSSSVSSSSVRMSNNQLREALSKFRSGDINLLIATNVVEEGLDVSECNLVICMNELLNVKAFIQMKGRARQKDSNFIFLCAHEEYNDVEKEKKNFGIVIEKMKELAFGKDSIGGIEPESNIIEQKNVQDTDFFEIASTGARVSLRDAKLVLDTFCKAAAEDQSSFPLNPSDEEQMANQMPEGAQKKPSKYVKDFTPSYQTKETPSNEDNKKFFVTALYLPKTCGKYVDYVYRFMPENGFLKKRDAENHVALLALRKLHQVACLDDYLFPKIGSWANQKKSMMSTCNPIDIQQKSSTKKQKSQNASNMSPGSNMQSQVYPLNYNVNQKRKAQISDTEIENFKNEQKEFERQLKSNRSRHFETVEAEFRSLIKEELQVKFHYEMGEYPKVYVHCLKGRSTQHGERSNEFPFKTTNDYLGIMFDRNFEQTNPIRFWMFQEKKQKDKNQEYLNQLLKNDIIDEDIYNQSFQDQDMIDLELNHKNLIEIDFSKMCNSPEEAMLKIQQLKFFHTWIFYYFYCADHKFLKHIFKQKFTFSKMIFGNLLDQIYSNQSFKDNFCKIYYSKTQKRKQKQNRHSIFYNKYEDYKQMFQMHPFIVPLLDKFDPVMKKRRLQVNWRLINEVIKSTERKLMDVIYCTKSLQSIISSYDLQVGSHLIDDRRAQRDSFKTFACSQHADRDDLIGVWDDQFTGVRYVQLDRYQSSSFWDHPTLHLEVRNSNAVTAQKGNDAQQYSGQSQYRNIVSDFVDISSSQLRNDDSKKEEQQSRSQRWLICSNREHRLDIFTVQQYNFEKYGLFLNPHNNRKIHVVRKERHFVDFSKTPKQLENEKQSQPKSAKDSAKDGSKKIEDLTATVSSKFDIAQQLLQKSPLSYDQYQVFQQTCTHLQYFNEFLQVEKFIRDKFTNLKCFLQPRDQQEILQMKEIQNKKALSIDQIISQQKENLQSDLEPSIHARDVFRSPDDAPAQNTQGLVHTSAADQLLNNIDLIMEALTSPNANRNYDYERLEFYGDSVISFLVILELFLTKDYAFKEGPLDFYRIQQVSNMKFYKINIDHHFFKYMINEPQTIFNDFVPGAFDGLRYQDRIKHKTLNELNNKVKELRKLQVQVNKLIKKLQKSNGKDFPFLSVPQIILQLRQYYYENWERKCSSFCDDQIYKVKNDQIKTLQTDESLLKEYLKKIDVCISKIEMQKKKRIEEIDTNLKNLSKRQNQQKMFFFKQLADVVESVTGAATVACGLNLTQNYLRSINVLEFTQRFLKQKLHELKGKKEGNLESRRFVQFKYQEMRDVETKIGYTFKNKLWLVEALTHKSYIDQNKYREDYNYPQVYNIDQDQSDLSEDQAANHKSHFGYPSYDNISIGGQQVGQTGGEIGGAMKSANDQFPVEPFDDYERLEFLGDAILNFLIAEHFYKSTVNDQEKKMPKELHKMKTSVINNALLSLIVIENEIHEHVLYNNKAVSFKEQFEKYVQKVKELLAQCEGKRTRTSKKALDLDQLYEYNLKIFGDVFESIIGAVFIDSESIEVTWKVLYTLMQPYIKIYADLSTLQDHSRTKLLELWNQKPFMRNLKCHHQIYKGPSSSNQISKSNDGRIIFKGMVDDDCILEVPYDKDAKNKVRSFYKYYYQLMKGFFDELDKKDKASGGESQNSMLFISKEEIIKRIKKYRDKKFKDQIVIAAKDEDDEDGKLDPEDMPQQIDSSSQSMNPEIQSETVQK